MYAANEMYITDIPTLAPDMVQMLEPRSITPETKVDLASLEEAQTTHESILAEQTGAADETQAQDGESDTQQTEEEDAGDESQAQDR